MSKRAIDYSKNAEIIWEKEMCPFCDEPTGKDSRCHKMNSKPVSSSEDPDEEGFMGGMGFMSNIVEQNNKVSKLFSEQCSYRRYNTYYIQFNYPLSQGLAVLIGDVEGVEKLIVESKYRATIIIANAFPEKEIKQVVTSVYQDFIKRQRVKDKTK